jgi:hypothetical protein
MAASAMGSKVAQCNAFPARFHWCGLLRLLEGDMSDTTSSASVHRSITIENECGEIQIYETGRVVARRYDESGSTVIDLTTDQIASVLAFLDEALDDLRNAGLRQ